ncbi:hypothetical protein WDY80_02265 [Gordonia hongkongensis]|uniref:hypothetical protein n=1 Tax=Gordonia hongkongensis TaxID=1701090 RepID=UPI0030CB5FE4
MAGYRCGTRRAVENDGVGPLRRPSGLSNASLTLGALSLATVIPTAVASINVTTLVHALTAPDTVQVATESTTGWSQPIPLSPGAGGPAAPSVAATPTGGPAAPMTRDLSSTGTPRTLVIDFPHSVGPIIAGGPRTRAVLSTELDDELKERAVQQNLAVMTVIAGLDANSPFVVYTGDAQGSGGPGAPGVPEGGTSLTPPPPGTDGPVIVLVSDPRGPWSIRVWLETIPLVSALLKSIGWKVDPPRTDRPVETPRPDAGTGSEPEVTEPPRGRPIEPTTDRGDTTSDAGADAETPRNTVETRDVGRETLRDIVVDDDQDLPTESADVEDDGDTGPDSGEAGDDGPSEGSGNSRSDSSSRDSSGAGDDSDSSDHGGSDSESSESAA